VSAGDALWLDVATDPSLLSTARLFAASAARLAGCDDDTTADVRLAISEACTRAIQGTEGAEDLVRVTAEVTGRDLTFTVEGPDGPAAPDAIPGVDLLASLFPTVQRQIDGGRATLRFAAPLA